MTDAVWLVRGHWENIRGWLPFEAPQDTEKVPDEFLDASWRIRRGQFLPADRFPIDNYPRKNDDEGAHRQRIPQIFFNGLIFICKESADVLRRFDLDEGTLYPTRRWHPNRATQVPGEFFYLSQGNEKDAFLRERSPEAAPRPGGRWSPPPNPVDNQLAFSTAVLDGPDIWWDKQVAWYFFISDRLARALKDAGIAEDWNLLRCRVIKDQGH